jgi:hypothetical protein
MSILFCFPPGLHFLIWEMRRLGWQGLISLASSSSFHSMGISLWVCIQIELFLNLHFFFLQHWGMKPAPHARYDLQSRNWTFKSRALVTRCLVLREALPLFPLFPANPVIQDSLASSCSVERINMSRLPKWILTESVCINTLQMLGIKEAIVTQQEMWLMFLFL